MGKLWKLKKSLCPYKKDPPTAMLDTHGNVVASAKGIEMHTLAHYKKVLSNRPMKQGLEGLQEAKEELCQERIKAARRNKSEPWTKENLDVLLKYLKKVKSRDPNDHLN